jgi:hypothetical protein
MLQNRAKVLYIKTSQIKKLKNLQKRHYNAQNWEISLKSL